MGHLLIRNILFVFHCIGILGILCILGICCISITLSICSVLGIRCIPSVIGVCCIRSIFSIFAISGHIGIQKSFIVRIGVVLTIIRIMLLWDVCACGFFRGHRFHFGHRLIRDDVGSQGCKACTTYSHYSGQQQ